VFACRDGPPALFALSSVGVGHLPHWLIASESVVPVCETPVVVVRRAAEAPSVVTAVGHKEHSFTQMGGSKISSSETEPDSHIPASGQISDHSWHCSWNKQP
jgi:hypothetical protein